MLLIFLFFLLFLLFSSFATRPASPPTMHSLFLISIFLLLFHLFDYIVSLFFPVSATFFLSIFFTSSYSPPPAYFSPICSSLPHIFPFLFHLLFPPFCFSTPIQDPAVTTLHFPPSPSPPCSSPSLQHHLLFHLFSYITSPSLPPLSPQLSSSTLSPVTSPSPSPPLPPPQSLSSSLKPKVEDNLIALLTLSSLFTHDPLPSICFRLPDHSYVPIKSRVCLLQALAGLFLPHCLLYLYAVFRGREREAGLVRGLDGS